MRVLRSLARARSSANRARSSSVFPERVERGVRLREALKRLLQPPRLRVDSTDVAEDPGCGRLISHGPMCGERLPEVFRRLPGLADVLVDQANVVKRIGL